MTGQSHQLSEFIRNTSISWTPATPAGEDTEVVTNGTMSVDNTDPEGSNLPTVLPVVIVLLVVLIIAVGIVIWCCRKRGFCLRGEKSQADTWAHYQTKTNPASSVYSVQNEIKPSNANNVYASNGIAAKSERALRYSGEPAVSSLPTSGRSVSYDYLGGTDMGSTWGNQRDSVSSDYGYYGSDTLHSSAVQLSKSVEPRSFLDPRESPERSFSSDQINFGRWPQVSRQPGSKASSLGRDSGLGDSQETVPYYDLKASLSNFSMDSALDENSDSEYTKSSPERPKSLPPIFGQLNLEDIKRVESSRLRGMNPRMSTLDENDNQPDIHKHIKYLRDKFYTMRNELASKGDPVHTSQTFGTTNFVIGIFDQEGGHLQLYDRSATLAIPPGALHYAQEVYLYSFYENACVDGKSYLRRVIECGPDGLTFKKPVCLSFLPKLIPCDEEEGDTLDLNVVYKNSERDEWRSLNGREAFWHAQPDFVTIHVNHFTRFTVEPGKSSGNQAAGAVAPQPPKASNSKGGAGSRKFYVSVYAGPTVAGTIPYHICFTERDKQKLHEHMSCMQKEGFHPAISSPKLLLLDVNGGDVHIEVPSLHGCDFRSKVKRHILPIDEFEDQTVEDIGPPQRELLLGPKGHNSDALFEVSVFQENVHDTALTVSVAMNLNTVKEKLSAECSPSAGPLTHRDVVEFLGGITLARYSPNVCFPKNMKLDICTKVETSSRSSGWRVLADEAQIPRNKAEWIKTYVVGKNMTPCYVVLDFIEAKLISKKISAVEACGQLSAMLERTGFEVAVDYCNAWRTHLLKQTSGVGSPHRDKANKSHFVKHADLAKLSQSREELGTIQEEVNTLHGPNGSKRRLTFGPGQPAQLRNRGVYSTAGTPNQTVANGAAGGLMAREQFEGRINYGNSSGQYVSAPENAGHKVPSQNQSRPESGPYTISGTPQSDFMRPKQVLKKGNGGKAGRNDSGIGSDIASPVDSEPADLHRHSHI